MTRITDQYYSYYPTMFSKAFVFSLLVGAVTAQLSPGLYRILNPEINSAGYVAKSGAEVGTPVVLSLSQTQPPDLHELVSLFLR
jgi:hypothetical protein